MKFQQSRWRRVMAILALGFVFAACGPANIPDMDRTRATERPSQPDSADAEQSGAGDAVLGAALFTQSIGGMPSCSTCHATDDSVIVGPGLAGIGAQAGNRVEGLTAEEYIHTSIIEPGAYVVEGFQNVMPDVFEQNLSEAQIRDLVAYLFSL